MHYFKRNIGDYYKKAGRLTMLEHGAYTLLMDACYDREAFPTMEQALDWCGARDQVEIDAVKSVLSKFFTLRANNTYFQQHISEVLADYKKKGKVNKEIALKRESTKRARNVHGSSTDRARTDHEPTTKEHLTTNHKPITNNQEPRTKEDSADKSPPRGKPLRTLAGYIEDRKTQSLKIIPDDHAVFSYASQAGIPHEYLQLAWIEFKTRYTTSPDDSKKYRDWGAVFLKAVKGNWLKVWYIEAGEYKLTTVGQQADLVRRRNGN